jgi:hypothetical protein
MVGPTDLDGGSKLQVRFIVRTKVSAVLETLFSLHWVGRGTAHCVGRWVWVPGQWAPKGLGAVLDVGVPWETTAAGSPALVLVIAGSGAVII